MRAVRSNLSSIFWTIAGIGLLVFVLTIWIGMRTQSAHLPGHPNILPESSLGDWSSIYYVQVQRAVKAYYIVHGSWPQSWKEVKDSGIFQSDLYGPKFTVIDPDDGKLDFFMDVLYVPGPIPEVRTSVGKQVGSTQLKDLPLTYSESLPLAAKHLPELDANYWLEDKRRLVQLAIIRQLSFACADFFEHKERSPKDIQELIESRYAPLANGAVNPVTGLPFRFDGSPGDLHITSKGDLEIRPVNDKGEVSIVGGFW